MEITIHHNPAFSNSRAALALIRAAGEEARIVEYLKSPLSQDEIATLLACMNASARDIVRSKEPRSWSSASNTRMKLR
jgi:arsenate reductase